MMKFVLILLILCSVFACKMRKFNPIYLRSKIESSYPSGSTISQHNEKYYVMGDDAYEILILDRNLEEVDRIGIFLKGDGIRWPKETKADIESSVLIDNNGKSAILFLGSGSLSPHRDSAFVLDPEQKEVKRIDTKIFFDELRREFVDLNIEAAAMVEGDLLLGQRGNLANPENYLLLAEFEDFSMKLKRKILIKSSLINAGVSGMDYDKKQDILFLTFSSEETSNAYDDGKIGESYLAFVSNAKQALKEDELNITEIIKMSTLSTEFQGQKIESVCIMNDNQQLMLVSDDDKGNSKIFTIEY